MVFPVLYNVSLHHFVNWKRILYASQVPDELIWV